jgi:hypothetical protein
VITLVSAESDGSVNDDDRNTRCEGYLPVNRFFDGDESRYAPSVCQFWQPNLVPLSPLWPRTRFLRWLHTDSEENYARRGNKAFSVESVGYEFNRLGYRGPQLDRAPGERAVLFVGDSNTLGLGMPWEGLWTSRVVEHLEQRWGVPVRQCNLAWGGTGPDYAAMMVHQSVGVLKPDAVFVLWSFAGRMTWFADTRRQVHFIPEWQPPVDTEEHAAYLRLATEPHGFFNYVRDFHLVYDRLARLGIPYYWGNLESYSDEMLAPYLPLEGYVGAWETLDLARDGRHGGLKSHEAFAARMIEVIEQDDLSPDAPGGRERIRTPVPDERSRRAPRVRRARLEAGPVHALIASVRLRRRIRALKRRDPFIY